MDAGLARIKKSITPKTITDTVHEPVDAVYTWCVLCMLDEPGHAQTNAQRGHLRSDQCVYA
jgi:hypothetical protein